VAFLHTGTGDASSDIDAEESLIPRLDAREVAAVFTAPFHKFLSDGRDDPKGAFKWYQGQWIDWNEHQWRMHSFFVPSSRKGKDGEAYKVWGLTARMLVDAARIAYDETPAFEHNEEFGEEDMIRQLLAVGRMDPGTNNGQPLSKEDIARAARLAKTKI
jgi:coenzyme A diphosphatase NUDT7